MTQTNSTSDGALVEVPSAMLRQLRGFVASTNKEMRSQELPTIEGDTASIPVEELRFLIETTSEFARKDGVGPRGIAARQVLRSVPADVAYVLYAPSN